MNFEGLELILQASLPVQIILAILCLASLLSWVLIFEKYFSLTRSSDNVSDLDCSDRIQFVVFEIHSNSIEWQRMRGGFGRQCKKHQYSR